MPGYRNNDLGLIYGQVLYVHDQRLQMTAAVQKRVVAGEGFEAAKRAVIDQVRPSWKHHPVNVREALYRVAQDIRFGDMGETVFRRVEEDTIKEVGREPTSWRRWLFRKTGVIW